MPEPTNLTSTKHPHEPMRDPVLDAEGRCWPTAGGQDPTHRPGGGRMGP